MAPEQFEPRYLDRSAASNTVHLDASTDVFAATATCVSLLLRDARPPFLPLDMRTELDRKLRAGEVLAHPWRKPGALRGELDVSERLVPTPTTASGVMSCWFGTCNIPLFSHTHGREPGRLQGWWMSCCVP